MTMPLVRVHGEDDVRLDDVDVPFPQEDDVLLEVALCGICGSDLGYIGMGGLGMTQPMPLGHELVGKVKATGRKATGVSVGDRVVVNPMAAGNLIGNGGSEGGFAPYLLVRGVASHPDSLYRVPDNISDEQAALVEPMSVALHACHQGAVRASDRVVVLGAGPIGLCTVACLNYLGVENVIAVDVATFRRDCAGRLGATVFDPACGNLAEFLMQQQGQAELLGMPVPATDVYIEATGVSAVFEQCVKTAKTGARIVVLGLHKAEVSLDLANVLLRELHIVGSMAYPSEFPDVLDMLSEGLIDTAPLVSHRFPLSEFDAALRQARDAGKSAKVLVDCQAGTQRESIE